MSGLRAQRARLNWQCRRGMRELDILLGGFLEQGYDDLDPAGRRVFEAVLAYPDTLLLEMLMGRLIPADMEVAHVVERIRNAAAP
jgi:antitoxin CptB